MWSCQPGQAQSHRAEGHCLGSSKAAASIPQPKVTTGTTDSSSCRIVMLILNECYCSCPAKLKNSVVFVGHCRKQNVWRYGTSQQPPVQEALLCVTETHSSHIISFIAALLMAFIPPISCLYLKNTIKSLAKTLKCWAGGGSVCAGNRITANIFSGPETPGCFLSHIRA